MAYPKSVLLSMGTFFTWALLNNDWPLSITRRHLADYTNLVEQAKGMDLPIKLGLEMDYIPETNELYPHLDLLKTCLERGVNITLASDAHEPEHVGFAFDRAASLLRDLGLRQLATFTNRQIKMVAL